MAPVTSDPRSPLRAIAGQIGDGSVADLNRQQTLASMEVVVVVLRRMFELRHRNRRFARPAMRALIEVMAVVVRAGILMRVVLIEHILLPRSRHKPITHATFVAPIIVMVVMPIVMIVMRPPVGDVPIIMVVMMVVMVVVIVVMIIVIVVVVHVHRDIDVGGRSIAVAVGDGVRERIVERSCLDVFQERDRAWIVDVAAVRKERQRRACVEYDRLADFVGHSIDRGNVQRIVRIARTVVGKHAVCR